MTIILSTELTAEVSLINDREGLDREGLVRLHVQQVHDLTGKHFEETIFFEAQDGGHVVTKSHLISKCRDRQFR